MQQINFWIQLDEHIATWVRITGVEIPNQNHIENNGQRKCNQSERPHDESMALGRTNHGIEKRSYEEAHNKTANMS